MEYLTRVINYAIDRCSFQYHPLCKNLKLTHFMFADDLLMFCKGNANSVMLQMRAFSTFSQTSGLNMNNSKYEVYFNGMDKQLKADFIQVTGFTEGSMPFRYLGMPIQAGRLTKTECNIIAEKMVSRIKSLGARKLYLGRLTLINSVLNTLYSYWANFFIIPNSVIKRVEAIYRNFLWDGSSDYHRVPLIYSKPDRLWIRWVAQVHIKNHDWHSYKPLNDASWIWKNILKVKDKIKDGFQKGKWQDAKGYSIRRGYNWLRYQKPVKEWANWKGMNVKEKLYKIGCSPDDSCNIYGMASETHDHLFFECSYSKQILNMIEAWNGTKISDLISRVTASRRVQAGVQWKTQMMVMNACIYHI
ncbi:uncharacterized protein LOC141655510 [Silene latifolia]|uniref:uncharacterized protein LOC141655510 n=1 Tax=Silene latifolia TaxID=37657 RepID=UPI003D774BB8